MTGLNKIWLKLTGLRDRDPLAFKPRPIRDWQIMIAGFVVLLAVIITSHIGLYFYWQSAGEVVSVPADQSIIESLDQDQLESIIPQLPGADYQAAIEIEIKDQPIEF